MWLPCRRAISVDRTTGDGDDTFIGIAQMGWRDATGFKAPAHNQAPGLASFGRRHLASRDPASRNGLQEEPLSRVRPEIRPRSQIGGAHAGW
jgi:hypothetical protein